jgi:hypothetical protein
MLDISLGWLRVGFNFSNAWIEAIDRTSAGALAPGAIDSRTRTRLYEIGQFAIEESIVDKKWRYNALYKSSEQIYVVHDRRLDLIWREVEDVF